MYCGKLRENVENSFLIMNIICFLWKTLLKSEYLPPLRNFFIYDIVQMTPDEYINKTKNKSTSNPLAGVDMNKVDKYSDQIKNGKKFDMPVLEYDEDNWVEHEGRHRALAMKQLGVNKIDVMVIKRIKPDLDKWYTIAMKSVK